MKLPAQPLEVMGTDIPHICMSPLAVREPLDVVNDSIPCFPAGGIATERRALTLEAAKASLGDSIVQARTLLTHATDDPLVG